MKGNTKGFTLVELLAVIVILAIIALITIPAILNVINDARIKGAQDKAWGTIDAVRLAYTQEQGMGKGKVTQVDGTYDICFGGSTGCKGAEKVGDTAVRFSGDKPTAGKVIINVGTGELTCDGLIFEGNGTYTCKSDGNKMCCLPQSGGTINLESDDCKKQY
ncbi:MAG: prepilin-type N-terminal cleavage/methylation domain-containing protein [Bacilli bacterium]|nr:prepilin-type N-terminal cleavage/methylation domain-containing protein [Bacilli bacterium]MBR3362665.1 prepilin-type N-terminal cleavage/methylation domain-containing protein [Bacilli bacterium]